METSVLTAGTIATGLSIPAIGEALKLRLPRALYGPGSTVTIPVSTNSHRFNYHTAFVTSVSFKSGIIYLEVLPVPSFSHPDEYGLSSSAWFLQQSSSYRARHLPSPYDLLSQPPNSLPRTQTPPEFGAPLYLNGWCDRRPSWVDIDVMEVELGLEQKFKRFNPPVLLTTDELMRIDKYITYYKETYQPELPAVNTRYANGGSDERHLSKSISPPNPHANAVGLQQTTGQRRFGKPWGTGHVLRLCEVEDGDDNTPDDNQDLGDGVDFEGYSKLFQPDDPYLLGLIENRRREVHARLVNTVNEWAGKVQSIAN